MNSMLRWTLQSAALASLASAAAGCVVTVEPATNWVLDPITESVVYDAGDSVRVAQDNGEITIRRGSGSELSAKFEPFTLRADDEEKEAKEEMQNDLVLTLEDQGAVVLVQVSKKDGSSSGLGAHVTVTLPSSFGGDIAVSSDNGGLDLSGGSGRLSIDVNNGSSSVAVTEWSALDGTVHVGNGGLEFTVAAGLAGYITAVADGPSPMVNDPDPMPEGWSVAESAASSKTYTFGAAESRGGTVALTTGNGDIDIFVN